MMRDYTYFLLARHNRRFNVLNVLDSISMTDSIKQVTIKSVTYEKQRPAPYKFTQIQSGYELVFTAKRHPLSLFERLKVLFGGQAETMAIIRIDSLTGDGRVHLLHPSVEDFNVEMVVVLDNLNRRKSL